MGKQEKQVIGKAEKAFNPFRGLAGNGLSFCVSFGWCGFGISGWKDFRSLNLNLGIVSLIFALGNIKNNIDTLFVVGELAYKISKHYQGAASGLLLYATMVNRMLRVAAEKEKSDFFEASNLLLPYAQDAFKYALHTTFPNADLKEVLEMQGRWYKDTGQALGLEPDESSKIDLTDTAEMDLTAVFNATVANCMPAVRRKTRSRKSGPDEGRTATSIAANPQRERRRRAARVAEKVSGIAGN